MQKNYLANKTNLVHRYIHICQSTVWYAGCTLHTRQSSTQNNKYQVSHKHNCVSWWWAHGHPKQAEIDKYKYTKKNCAQSWFYLQNYREVHGQRNIKNIKLSYLIYNERILLLSCYCNFLFIQCTFFVRLRISGFVSLLPIYAFMACTGTTLTVLLLLNLFE
jgi:hypothetical protein